MKEHLSSEALLKRYKQNDRTIENVWISEPGLTGVYAMVYLTLSLSLKLPRPPQFSQPVNLPNCPVSLWLPSKHGASSGSCILLTVNW